MSETPEVIEVPDDQDGDETNSEANTPREVVESSDETEVVEAEVELTDDDLGGGLFDGVEESESEAENASDDGDGGGDGDDTEDSLDDIADGLDGNAGHMEGAINDGAARLAVVGLTDDDFDDSSMDKETLEEEFQEVFAAFRLGYFASRTVDEYVLAPEDEEVDPIWGLAGSLLMATAMIVWMRPDGDEKVASVRDTIESMGGLA